jgi:hypothetical protein
MPVIKAEDEMSFIGTKGLQSVTMTFREIPDVAWSEIVLGTLAVWGDDRCANISLYHEGPLGRDRVPVQLAKAAWFQPHGNAGNTRRNRQLFDRRFLRRTALANPAFAPLQVMFKIVEGFMLFSRLRHGLGFGNTN